MIDAPTTGQGAELAEQALRDELARCDAAIAGARPVLRSLLANEDAALFSDAVIARMRGMMLDLAAQLLSAQATAAEVRDLAAFLAGHRDGLALALASSADLLAHVHVRVLEAQIAERLQAHNGLDPVTSPLVQQSLGDPDPELAELATAVLTAQGRFMRQVRKMELPLGELPAELFDQALAIGREFGGTGVAVGERGLRGAYDASAIREALLTRFASRAAEQRADLLSLDHAGLAVFVTALAVASRQPRERVMTSFADSQLARLALSLRSAGLTQQAMEMHFQLIHPEHSLPPGFEIVPADRAAALLSTGAPAEAST